MLPVSAESLSGARLLSGGQGSRSAEAGAAAAASAAGAGRRQEPRPLTTVGEWPISAAETSDTATIMVGGSGRRGRAAAYAAGTGGEHAVLIALADSRLLVPVVAVRRRPTEPGAGEKASEMAMPEIVGRDGRRPAGFHLADAVQRWRPAARPVPVPAAGVWQSAVQESCAVVIDIAGPVPMVIEGAGWRPLPRAVTCLACTRILTSGSRSRPPRRRSRPASGCGSASRGGLDFTLELAPPAGSAGLVPDERREPRSPTLCTAGCRAGSDLASPSCAGLASEPRRAAAVLRS